METIQLLDGATARLAIFLAKSYDHELRRSIIELLRSHPGGLSVTDIYTNDAMRRGKQLEQSMCSQHLAWLRRHNIVRTERRGKQIIYTLNANAVRRAGELIRQLADLAKPAN